MNPTEGVRTRRRYFVATVLWFITTGTLDGYFDITNTKWWPIGLVTGVLMLYCGIRYAQAVRRYPPRLDAPGQ